MAQDFLNIKGDLKEMKKSLVLGAAALAAVAMAAPQNVDAGEVKIGGYYMFRAINANDSVAEVEGVDDKEYWAQRLQLNFDFIHDKKTKAFMRTRVMDTNVVQGADANNLKASGTIGRPVTGSAADEDLDAGNSHWDVRYAYMQTEIGGVGVKVGNMPISLNDDILIATDTSGFGAVMLSKTFGNPKKDHNTVIVADVRVREGATNIDDDVEDLYALVLAGKQGKIKYTLTGARYVGEENSTASTDLVKTNEELTDNWLAATIETGAGGNKITGTVIYETGMDGAPEEGKLEGSGYLAAVRVQRGDIKKDKMQLDAYGFWSSEDFTNITEDNMVWSKTWDMGGPGAEDLLGDWSGTAGASPSENMMGVGIGAKIKLDKKWIINPMLDYATVVEDVDGAITSSAVGGGVHVSHKINKKTTLGLTGLAVSPNDEGDGTDNQTLHFLEASLKMKF